MYTRGSWSGGLSSRAEFGPCPVMHRSANSQSGLISIISSLAVPHAVLLVVREEKGFT